MDDRKYTDICQSCAMPMGKTDEYGKNADGSQNYQYCMNCFQKGQFTQPEITVQEMINGCIDMMVKYGVSEEDAKAKISSVIPTLERWRK